MNFLKNNFQFKRYLSVLFLLALFGCLDEDIEGASNSQPFKASKVASTFVSINNCTLTSGGSNGTNFTIRIDIQGQRIVSFVDGEFRFSSQTSFTPVSSFAFTQTGGSAGGTFRSSTSSSTANYITITQCIRFGTSTSITFNFEVTSENFETSTISLTIQKPTGAN